MAVPAQKTPEFLKRLHGAGFLDVSPRTLDTLPIRKFRVGKRVFYRKSDLEAFMLARAEEPVKEKRTSNPLADLLRDVARRMGIPQNRKPGANRADNRKVNADAT